MLFGDIVINYYNVNPAVKMPLVSFRGDSDCFKLACIAGAGSFIGRNFEDARDRRTRKREGWPLPFRSTNKLLPATQASFKLFEIIYIVCPH